MDKLDKAIKNAQKTYQPTSDFVSNTMKQIIVAQPKKRWGIKLWVPALAASFALIAIVLTVLVPADHSAVSTASQHSKTISSAKSSQVPNSSPTGTTSNQNPDTDDDSLQSDLNGIGNSISQENNDQNTANSGLNDSQQEITVPTN